MPAELYREEDLPLCWEIPGLNCEFKLIFTCLLDRAYRSNATAPAFERAAIEELEKYFARVKTPKASRLYVLVYLKLLYTQAELDIAEGRHKNFLRRRARRLLRWHTLLHNQLAF